MLVDSPDLSVKKPSILLNPKAKSVLNNLLNDVVLGAVVVVVGIVVVVVVALPGTTVLQKTSSKEDTMRKRMCIFISLFGN